MPFGERMSKFWDLIVNADAGELARGADALVSRVAYVEMLSHVLRRVPDSMPHTEGLLWRDALAHVAMPRILFPDKPRLLSDSELTMRYTGLLLASDAGGTSISMGYVTESYIDFGVPGMFLPVLIVGFVWGAMYRFMMSRDSPLLAFDLTAPLDLFKRWLP